MKIVHTCAALSVAALICVITSQSQVTPPPAAPAPATQSPATGAAPAVPAAPTIPLADQPSREEVIKLLEAMGVKKQLENMNENMGRQMKQMIDRSLHDQTSPEQKSKKDAAYEEASNLYPVQEMVDDVVPVYQSHISKQDVAAIIAFYESPAGKRLQTEGPSLMQAVGGAVMPKARSRTQALVQKMQKEAAANAPKPAAAAPGPGPAGSTTPAPAPAPPAPKPDAPTTH